MEIAYGPKIVKKLKGIKQTDADLFKRTTQQIKLFAQNPKHPSLRIHKLKGELGTMWSFSVDQKIRVVYRLEGGTAFLLFIGTHDEVYR